VKRPSDSSLSSYAWCALIAAVLVQVTRQPVPQSGTLYTISGEQPQFAVLHTSHTQYGGEFIQFTDKSAHGCSFIGPKYVELREYIIAGKTLSATCGSSWSHEQVAVTVKVDGFMVLSEPEYMAYAAKVNGWLVAASLALAVVGVSCMVVLNMRASERMKKDRNA